MGPKDPSLLNRHEQKFPKRGTQESGLNPGRKRYVTSPMGAMPINKGAVIMADNPSQTKPVNQTADVPAGVTGTPASDIPKITIKKEENQMADLNAHNYKNFVDARDKFREKLKCMCEHAVSSQQKIERMKKVIAEL